MLPTYKSLAPCFLVFLIANSLLINAQYAVTAVDDPLGLGPAVKPLVVDGGVVSDAGAVQSQGTGAPFPSEYPLEGDGGPDLAQGGGFANGGKQQASARGSELFGMEGGPEGDAALPQQVVQAPRGGDKKKRRKRRKRRRAKKQNVMDGLDISELVNTNQLAKVGELSQLLNEEKAKLVQTLEQKHSIGKAGNGLDATCKKELLKLISDMFNKYDGQNHDVRPLYAPPNVVNDAYKHYTGKKGPCLDKIREAVFSYPPRCMEIDLSAQPAKPQYVGVNRKPMNIEKRTVRPCLFTKVMCVEPKDLVQSPEHLVEWIKRQFARKEPFWFQNRIFARPSTIHAAWRLLYKKEPVDYERGGICTRLPNNVDTNMGSLQAKFPDPTDCYVAGRYKGGDCKVVNVECLTP